MVRLDNSLIETIERIDFGSLSTRYFPFCPEAPYAVRVGDKTYATLRHYYESQKFAGRPEEELVRDAASAEEAIYTAERFSHLVLPNWDLNDVDRLLRGLQAKFSQHVDLESMLLQTGEADLVYHSPDIYLGVNEYGEGVNLMGKLLRKVRRQLRRNRHLIETTELERLEEHVKTYPNDAVALTQLASEHRPEGRLLTAKNCLLRALEINSGLAKAHFGLGLIMSECGQYGEAYREYTLAKNLAGEDEGQILTIGFFCVAERRIEDALAMIHEQIAQGEKSYESYLDLACAAAENGEMPLLVRRALQEARGFEPRSLSELTARASQLIECQSDRAAVVVLEEIVRQYPALFEAYTQLTEVYVRQEKLEEALGVCHRLTREEPNCVDAYITSGLICEHMTYYSIAYDHLRQALWLESDNVVTLQHMENVCRHLGKNAEAEKYRRSYRLRRDGAPNGTVDLYA